MLWTKRRRRTWIFLFVSSALLLVILATGWNVVLVSNYQRMLDIAKNFHIPQEGLDVAPWTSSILGTLGFLTALVIIILFFIKILREMKLNQAQAEFLAAVSHELKTPIASIELTSSLLRSGGLSEDEKKQLWSSHEQELKRLRGEVESILEAARWQSGPAKLNPVSVDLEAWVTASMPRWQRILGTNSSLLREGDPLPKQTMIDLSSLTLTMDNLFDNARKFAREGTPKVTLRTEAQSRKWKIEIQDDGWGFDPAEAKRIFNRFSRARHGAPYSIPGTGLGLYLANSASRAQGIRLKGSSEGHGRGATFTLEGRVKERREK